MGSAGNQVLGGGDLGAEVVRGGRKDGQRTVRPRFYTGIEEF